MMWKKLGKIFDLESHSVPNWMKSHASVPFVGEINGSQVKVYFSSRDEKKPLQYRFIPNGYGTEL